MDNAFTPLKRPRGKGRRYNKNASTVSRSANAACESFFTGFTQAYVHTDVLGGQVVKERAIPWREEFKNYLLVIVTVIFCALLFVWSRLEVVQMGYEISRANQSYQSMIKENQRLRVEAASLKSPSRIEKIAKNQMGFVNPKQEQIIFIP